MGIIGGGGKADIEEIGGRQGKGVSLAGSGGHLGGRDNHKMVNIEAEEGRIGQRKEKSFPRTCFVVVFEGKGGKKPLQRSPPLTKNQVGHKHQCGQCEVCPPAGGSHAPAVGAGLTPCTYLAILLLTPPFLLNSNCLSSPLPARG